jgi:hypothetical protein
MGPSQAHATPGPGGGGGPIRWVQFEGILELKPLNSVPDVRGGLPCCLGFRDGDYVWKEGSTPRPEWSASLAAPNNLPPTRKVMKAHGRPPYRKGSATGPPSRRLLIAFPPTVMITVLMVHLVGLPVVCLVAVAARGRSVPPSSSPRATTGRPPASHQQHSSSRCSHTCGARRLFHWSAPSPRKLSKPPSSPPLFDKGDLLSLPAGLPSE